MQMKHLQEEINKIWDKYIADGRNQSDWVTSKGYDAGVMHDDAGEQLVRLPNVDADGEVRGCSHYRRSSDEELWVVVKYE